MKPAFKSKAGYKQSSFRYEFFPEQPTCIAGAAHYRAGHGVSRICRYRRRYWRWWWWWWIAAAAAAAAIVFLGRLGAAALTLGDTGVIQRCPVWFTVARSIPVPEHSRFPEKPLGRIF